MPVSTQMPLALRTDLSSRSAGAALAVASVVGGAVVATLARLRNARPVRQAPPPAEAEVGSDPHKDAQAEDAIQRTLEGRSF